MVRFDEQRAEEQAEQPGMGMDLEDHNEDRTQQSERPVRQESILVTHPPPTSPTQFPAPLPAQNPEALQQQRSKPVLLQDLQAALDPVTAQLNAMQAALPRAIQDALNPVMARLDAMAGEIRTLAGQQSTQGTKRPQAESEEQPSKRRKPHDPEHKTREEPTERTTQDNEPSLVELVQVINSLTTQNKHLAQCVQLMAIAQPWEPMFTARLYEQWFKNGPTQGQERQWISTHIRDGNRLKDLVWQALVGPTARTDVEDLTDLLELWDRIPGKTTLWAIVQWKGETQDIQKILLEVKADQGKQTLVVLQPLTGIDAQQQNVELWIRRKLKTFYPYIIVYWTAHTQSPSATRTEEVIK